MIPTRHGAELAESAGEPAFTGTDAELEDLLGHGYEIVACTRVWEAWQYGTMTEVGFIPAAEAGIGSPDAVPYGTEQQGAA